MAYNNSRKKSFFAEQRESNTNPNFFNNMDPTLIRNNVKRIIRDISDNIIIPEDYIYFTNAKVINACIQESYETFQSCQTLRHALTAYRTIILPNGMVTPDVDVSLDYILTANELVKISAKENVWATAYKIFSDIANGADAKSALIYMTRFPKQIIRSL